MSVGREKSMSTSEQRTRMAAAILSFEARRDREGHLAVYPLPEGDGGGRYEVAGINERYNKETVDVLVSLIQQRRYDEAERLATEFIAQDTDRVSSWTSVPAIEFYLRDSVFNRGASGGARILQRALGATDDGVVGPKTQELESAAETNSAALLAKLRIAREQYERNVVHRDESNKFWKGLVNRWNKALEIAKSFPLSAGVRSMPLGSVEHLQTEKNKLRRTTRNLRGSTAAAAIAHDENHVDACDIEFRDSPATPDHELPPATGGVELTKKTRERKVVSQRRRGARRKRPA
jgi:hypothetical protein